MMKALRKRAPSRKRKRFPILTHHLRALRERLNMNDPRDRAFWTLVLCAWQGVRRIGDLIMGDASKSKHKDRTWDPAMQTTVSRLRRVSSAIAPAGSTFVLLLKPTKTDPSGEEGWEALYPIDMDPDSLSAGASL